MSGKLLRSLYVLALPAAFVSNSAFAACVSLSALDSAYAQNFDSLSNAGKSSTLPTGWALAESGTSANNDGQYGVDDGTSTGGDTYSYGAAGSTERAFGTLQSGTLVPAIGACFSNDTGGTITSIDIAYTGEEWRLGTASRAVTDALNFEYSLDATSLTTGTWTAATALNFTTPDNVTTGKKNGNSAGERTALSSAVSGLSVAAGATVWIHWIDTNASGADDGLAVDDFSLTPHGTAGGGSTNPSGVGAANPSTVPADGATPVFLTVTVTKGTNPDSVSYTVTADLSSIGGPATQTLYDDGTTGGDVTANDGIFSNTATVAPGTSAGAKSLAATITDDQNRTGNTSIALTVTAVPITATIMQIQGHGAASPLNTQLVTTSGIVTVVGPKGFFMQDQSGDGDSTTSDGIYVYTGSAPTVNAGDSLAVTATVQEFSGSTELSSASITVNGTGYTMPAAYVLDTYPPTNDPTTGPCVGGNSTLGSPPTASEGYQASNFACLDGMLVKMNDAVVTGATFGSGSDGVHVGTPSGFYATLASQPRPFHGPGALYPGLGGTIPVWNGEPEVIEVYYKGLGFAPGSDDPLNIDPNYSDPSDYVYHAGTRFSVTGVIQGFQPAGAASPTYELYPASMTTNTRVTPADTVQPVSDPVTGTLTIGSQNLLHFFNASADGADTSGYNDTCAGTGATDTCPTPAEYAARLAKWTHMICTVLKSPVVLDVEEIENLSVARDLAASVFDTTSVNAVGCGTSYVPYLIPGNDVSGINIGILVRSDVTVDSVTQMYSGSQTSNCSSGTSCGLNDRPPVLMRATWNGYPFALLAIYDRSLSGIDTKPYVGPKRAEQAAQIASIAQAFQSGATLTGAGNAQQASDGTITTGTFDIVGDANVPLIIAGDFNAYEFSDGYADVTGMITGNAVQSDNLYWYNGYDSGLTGGVPAYVAPSPTLVDSGIKAKAGQRYSFNFDGLVQEIDHIVLSRRAWQDFVRIDNAHGNSDASEASGAILDTGTAARSGDHDGQVVTIAIDRIFADGFGQQP